MKIICALLALNYLHVSVSGNVTTGALSVTNEDNQDILESSKRNDTDVLQTEAHFIRPVSQISMRADDDYSTPMETRKYTQTPTVESSEANGDRSSDSSVVESEIVNASSAVNSSSAQVTTEIYVEKLESLETVEHFPQRRQQIETETFLSYQEEINYTPTPHLGKRTYSLILAGSFTAIYITIALVYILAFSQAS